MLFRVYSRYVPDMTRQDGSAIDSLLLASKKLAQEQVKQRINDNKDE